MRLIFLSLLIFFGGLLRAQSPTYFDLEIDQEVKHGHLYISFYVTKTSGGNFAPSGADLIISVDTAGLSFFQTTKVDSMDGLWDNNLSPASYRNLLLGRNKNLISLGINRNTNQSGTGVSLSPSRERIGGIRIPVIDSCVTTTIQWHTQFGAISDYNYVSYKPYASFINPDPDFPLCSKPEAPALQASGPLAFCEGDNLTLNAGSPVNWYRDSVMIGSGVQITVNQSGWYHAVAANCICEAPSQAMYVEVAPLPVKPFISTNGTGLSSSFAANYQWYLNGQILAGDTNQNLIPTASGNYTVSTINDCGITMSDPYNLQISGIDEVISSNGFAVYPNPYKGMTTVYYTLLEPSDLVIEVFSAKGDKITTLVNEREHPSGKHQKNFSAESLGFSAGTYLLKFNRNSAAQTVKLIEIH